MNINNAKFVVSAVSPAQYPGESIPEFALAGRSNVGKSSMINKLMNRKSLARISSKPGKTATINFYNIDDAMHLVDLPGYGYAARSKEDTKEWGNMIETYLSSRPQLVATILLVDSRHNPTEDDRTMLEWIRHFQENAIVIATKTDKVKKSELEYKLYAIEKTLKLTDDDLLVPFSVNDEEGRITLWDIIHQMIGGDSD
jgi:GTP-binding protein